jgi:hypothetical protein
VKWGPLIVDQLEFYWNVYFRPRLEGLTDEEYFWEPVDNCWNLRRNEQGVFVLDWEWPEPSPSPVTTVAWRILHVATGCFANRTSAFFGDGSVPDDAPMHDPRHRPSVLPETAAEGVALLDQTYQRWRDAIAALSETEIESPLGPKGGHFAKDPMGGLVLHINREVMHHGGEICLLRDLYRTTGAKTRQSRLVPTGESRTAGRHRS